MVFGIESNYYQSEWLDIRFVEQPSYRAGDDRLTAWLYKAGIIDYFNRTGIASRPTDK